MRKEEKHEQKLRPQEQKKETVRIKMKRKKRRP